MSRVVIIDYKLSNLFSVLHACEAAGLKPVISSKKDQIEKARALILPGVGAFGDAMKNLGKLNLIGAIKRSIERGKPFLGICLGFQLLFSKSEEFGPHKGLNLISGRVLKFKGSGRRKIKVPQIGWNKILYPQGKKKEILKNAPLKNIKNRTYMYFVHSFYARPDLRKEKNLVIIKTNYERIEYCSAIIKNNIFATQFHPEKSGEQGIRIYKNWAKSFGPG
ncbi:imidazole glycerol phosphate synthase subunit HisH [Patescibacteria group bacterium]|nr:imidazole glycerol phosphate synthase subunit HisH [Patescibacteria group bacterium]